MDILSGQYKKPWNPNDMPAHEPFPYALIDRRLREAERLEAERQAALAEGEADGATEGGNGNV
jgi:hypothetical protein